MAKTLNDDTLPPPEAVGKPSIHDFARGAALGPTPKVLDAQEPAQSPIVENNKAVEEAPDEEIITYDDSDGPVTSVNFKVPIHVLNELRSYTGWEVTRGKAKKITQQDLFVQAIRDLNAKLRKRKTKVNNG